MKPENANNSTKRSDLFHIDPRNIVVQDGFNVRKDFDLDELKEQIKAYGVLNPVTVIPFKDADGVERYKLVDGERRYRATMLAIEEGADIKYIKAIKAPRGAKLETLCQEQMMRNEGKRFTEYESALMFRRFRDVFGYTQTQIADKFKKSPAYVSKCLSLLDMPPQLQQQIVEGKISIKAAKAIMEDYDSDEQDQATSAAIQSAVKDGRTMATNKDVQAQLKDRKDVQALRDAIFTMQGYMHGKDILHLSVLQTKLKISNKLSVAFELYWHEMFNKDNNQ